MNSKKDAPPDFEAALADIEKILDRLESGDLSLEQSLVHYEKGVDLARHCQKALEQAQRRVAKLTDLSENGGSPDFDRDSS